MKHVYFITAFCFLFSLSKSLKSQDDCATAVQLECASPTAIFPSSYFDDTSLPAYTPDIAPTCFGVADGTGAGVWVKFVGTGDPMVIDACGSAYDTRVRVYDGTCGALNCVASGDDECGAGGLQTTVTLFTNLGTMYYALIHGGPGGAEGFFSFKLTCPPPPPPSTFCYTEQAIPYTPEPFAGIPLSICPAIPCMSDDSHSDLVNIGFDFCFNGVSYNSCVVSSNNYITFDAFLANTYSPWNTVPVPTSFPAQISNSILAPWQDTNPSAAPQGQIFYQTYGTAPDRYCVITYNQVTMFSCSNQQYTSQTILYEGSNCIATMISQKPVCSTWNGGEAVHGVHNNDGTDALTVPGRNNTAWPANSEGRLFTPTCVPCQTATTANCLNIILPVDLLYFRGNNNIGRNELVWATASEHNSHHYVLERSHDGEIFVPITTIDAAGNSEETIAYEFVDSSPLTGINYYRLQSVDIDGSASMSEIVALETILEGDPLIYPNPATNEFYVRLPSNVTLPTNILVRDIYGREIRNIQIDAVDAPISLDDLASGAYFVEIPALGFNSATRLMVE